MEKIQNASKNRLQFVHHDGIFSTREEAIEYVEKQYVFRNALYGEPIVLKYGDETDPNIILGIGSVEDENPLNIRTYWIDFTRHEELIEDAQNKIQQLFDELHNLEDVVEQLRKEFDELYIFVHNRELHVSDTNSISLTLTEPSETGITLSSDVNLAKTIVNSENKVIETILIETEDGIYTNVDLAYSGNGDTLKLLINGEIVSEYPIPTEVHAVGGKYNTSDETLTVIMSDESSFDIDLRNLAGEWKFKANNESESPIYFSVDRVKSDIDEYGDEVFHSVVSANVRLTDMPNNIIKIHGEGTTDASLFVKGTADNIKYKDETVDDALNTIMGRGEGSIIKAVSDEKERAESVENILSNNLNSVSGDLYSFSSETVSNMQKEEQIRRTDDEKINERIDVLKEYAEAVSGEVHTEKYAVRNEIATVSGKIETDLSAVEKKLTLKADVPESRNMRFDIRETEKGTFINGFVKVDENAEGNIIQGGNNINGSALYAKADLKYNAKNNTLALYKSKGLEDFCELNNANLEYIESTNTLIFTSNNNSKKEIQLNVGSIVDRIYYVSSTEEIVIVYTNAQGVECETRVPVREMLNEWEPENGNHTVTLIRKENIQGKDKLTGDVNVSTKSDNILKVDNNSLYVSNASIVENDRKINELAASLNDEVNRAKNEENILTQKLETEIVRAENAETALISSINGEIDRAKNAEETLRDAIIAEQTRANASETQIQTNLDAEVTRATNSENTLDVKINSEISRAQLAENTNADAISSETERATTAEGELSNKIQTNSNNISIEVDRAEKAEEILKDTIIAEQTRAEKAEEKLNDTVIAEQTRAEKAEEKLNDAIVEAVINSTNSIETLKQKLIDELNKPSKEDIIIHEKLQSEIDRAKEKEVILEDKLNAEIARSTNLDESITKLVTDETIRATNAEATITSNLTKEITRAENQEELLGNSIHEIGSRLNDEKERALGAEQVLSDEIKAEKTRAERVETSNSNAINTEKERAISAENSLATSIASNKTAIETEISRSTEKDTALENITTSHSNALLAISKDIDSITKNVDKINSSLNKEIGNIISNKVYTNNTDSITLSETVTEVGTTIKGYVNVSTAKENIIVGGNSENGGSLFASIDLEYNGSSNVLKLIKSNGESKEIVLNAGSIINNIAYIDKNLVITYTTSSGNITNTKVPVADFFREMVTDNTDGGVDITIKQDESGKWVFSADANVAESPRQALKKVDNTLFVSNQATDYYLSNGNTVEKGISDLVTNNNNFNSLLQEEINRATSVENGLRKDIESISGKTSEFSNNLSVLEAKVNTNTTNIASLSADVTTLKSDVSNAKVDIANIKTDVTSNKTNISNLTTKVDNIDGRVTSNANEISNIKSSLTGVGTDVNDIKAQVITNKNDIFDLKPKVSANTASINSLSATTANLDGKITTINANITTISGQVATNTADIRNLKEKISDISVIDGSLSSISGQVVTNTTNITALTNRITKVEGDITNLTSNVNNISDKVTSSITKVESLEKIIQESGADLTSLKLQVNTNTTNIGIISGNVTNNTSNIAKNTTAITEIQNALKGYVAKSGDTMTGNLTVNADIRATGTITANGAMYSSDVTLKENIKTIDCDKLNAVSNVELKSYNFISDVNKVQKYGIIAQELESVGLNELVHEGENGKKSVDYISFLILKIAQLQSEIDELKKNK